MYLFFFRFVRHAAHRTENRRDGARNRRAATARPERIWDYGVIPYEIQANFSGKSILSVLLIEALDRRGIVFHFECSLGVKNVNAYARKFAGGVGF